MDYVYENHLPIDSLQLLILGSDICPVRDFKKLLTRFGERMRIINSYGVTEATIDSSYYEEGIVERIPPVSSIPIGKPLPNVKFYILNSAGTLMPPGVPGELHIGGESVTRGYLNNPELTAEKFDQNFFDDQDYQDNKGPATREPFKKKEKGTAKLKHMSYMSYLPYLKLYHTGDLARWLPDGNIEFLGRMDNQIKVRGFRIELGEIENKLLEHADIKQAAVLERITENDDKYLCGYVISDKNLEPADLRDFLGKKLPDYMVPWFFVQMEQFPLTPTGKIDRKALPEPETSGEVKYVAPRDKTEEKLVELWSKVLGKEKEEIGIDTNFFDLGGNSIKAIVLTTKMHKELNVKLLMTDIFILQTIRKISELIKETEEEKFIPIEPTEKKEYYRLSPAQKRLYILQQMKLNSTAYNMPLTVTVDVKIQEGLKKERLETIFCQLIERHESVRTSFEMIKREPVQRIHNKVEFRIEFYDMTRTQVEAGMPHSPQDIIKNFLKPFDLSHAPLLRVGLMKTGNEGHLLMVDMHHIITDGISHQILINDFLALDEGEALPSLRIQYKDFSEWQNRDKQKEAVKMQEAYWLKQFERGIPVLNLPTDYPRDEVEGYEGSFIRFEIGVEETNALRQMILAEDTTMFMLLLAVTYVLFLNLGGQEGIGIVMGTVAAGRSHYDLEQVIGMFVNTLALINYPQKEKTFAEFLQEVKKRVLDAFENQDYQFEDLVDKVGVKRNPGRHPLFDVMFTFQTSEPISDTVNKKVSERAILTVEQEQRQLEYENIDRTAKFDLTFNGVDAGEKLFFEVEYSTKLFKKETIQRYARYYKEILFCVLENKETQLKEIKISHDLYEEQLDNPQIVFGF
jgi:acyl carrier protein